MNKHNKIKKIISLNQDGFTISFKDLKKYSENKGFSIGLTNLKGRDINLLINKVLITARSFKQIENKLFIGGWFNQSDKMFYLDLSIIENDLNNALYLKSLFNQISIFNFQTLECI